jgi:hypothetical protein
VALAGVDSDAPPRHTGRYRRHGALFCSEKARWITGQVIAADGGSSLMNSEMPTEMQLG